MRHRPTAYELCAFVIGAISDVFLIRNGFSYGGLTLLDKYPIIWPIWLTVIFLCSLLFVFQLYRSHEKHTEPDVPGRARASIGSGGMRITLAILLGALVMHTVLLIRDVIADPSSHNIWPMEYLFWGIVLAVPCLLGWGLARVIFGLLNRGGP
jgi:hypothetical protein